MRDDKTYLRHILDAIESIEDYIGQTAYEQFASNKMMLDAVIRELEIIGEAVNNLSRQFRDTHSQILWRRMKDMRNFLIHDYFGVNTKVVWDTCRNDIPVLKGFVKTSLDS